MDKPELKLVRVKSKPMFKPITDQQRLSYQSALIYAGRKPRSDYNGGNGGWKR